MYAFQIYKNVIKVIGNYHSEKLYIIMVINEGCINESDMSNFYGASVVIIILNMINNLTTFRCSEI